MKIKIKDYIEHEGKDNSERLAKVLENLQEGDTLLLGGECIHFYQEGTTQKYYYISNNDCGEKRIVFPLLKKKNIIIDGEGAELIFHGKILPFVIDECQGITIRNLSIDYTEPMYIQAEIKNAGKEYFELQFDEKEFKYREHDGKIWIYHDEYGWETEFCHCLAIEMEREKKRPDAYKDCYITETEENVDHGFLNDFFKYIKCKNLGNGRLAISGKIDVVHNSGNYWVGTFHYNRDNPGIFINDSKDICLENIEIYHALSMGVIGQLSENIILNNVNTRLRDNTKRFLSVCADSVHFVNCRGKIKISNCVFSNMLDDALNIHGIYHIVQKIEGKSIIRSRIGHFQQAGIVSYKTGDKICIIDRKTGKRLGFYTVKEAGSVNSDEIWIETNETLELFENECVIENMSANPEIQICQCESGNNRPRGFLLASPKKITVENCTFYNMHEAISISAGIGGWYESGCVKDVVIRNNNFKGSAYAGGIALYIVPCFEEMEKQSHLYGNVLIEENTFTQAEKRILQINAVENLIFKNNRFICDMNMPSHEPLGEEGVQVVNCERVEYEPVIMS